MKQKNIFKKRYKNIYVHALLTKSIHVGNILNGARFVNIIEFHAT